MKRTPEEIIELKKAWLNDPSWPIEDAKGFENHRAELSEFCEEMNSKWHDDNWAHEEFKNVEARRLGVEGIYRMLLHQNALIEKQTEVISALLQGDSRMADLLFRELSFMQKK